MPASKGPKDRARLHIAPSGGCIRARVESLICSVCGGGTPPAHLPGDRHAYCGQCCPICRPAKLAPQGPRGAKAPRRAKHD